MEPVASYGDLTALNTNGTLLNTIGKVQLVRMAKNYMGLLSTSVAIYEANGDYASALFTSDYCRLLAEASRRLCDTDDDAAALASGCWHCHESCWTDASKVAVESGQPVDLRPCRGGINIYAVPIIAGSQVIGSINFGYGTPPRDDETLREIAQRYRIDLAELRRAAMAYEPRPAYVIEVAKNEIAFGAEMLADWYLRRMQLIELSESEAKFRAVAEQTSAIIFITHKGHMVYVNPRCEAIMGYTRAELYAEDFDLGRVIAEEHQSAINEHFARHLQGEEQPPLDFALITKGGKRLYAVLTTSLIDYRGTRALLSVVTDITRFKEQEQRLLKQLDELVRFQRLTLEREVRMREVKDENELLKARIAELEQRV